MKKIITTLLFSTLLLVSLKSQAQCGTPVNLQSSYSNNVSTFTWDGVPGATEYTFEIDWAGGGWSFGEMPTSTNSFSIAGLMQGGEFQWRVRANCNGTYSNYSTTAFYNSPCLEPYNLSTTAITTNSAVLNWAQSSTVNNNNTGYSVSYRRLNTGNWIQLTNIYNNPTAPFLNLTGLLPGTVYEWRVRRACSYFNSNYIYSQFATLACIPAGNNTNEWISQFTLGTINRLSAAETGGYKSTGLATNLVIGSTGNAGQIRAGFPGMVRNERFNVYIDFNRNGSFADPGEALVNGSNATLINGTTIKNFSINIPATATAGPTAMRVVMRRNNSGSVTSCITGYQGEAEDYIVNLVASGNKTTGSNTGQSPVASEPEKPLSMFSVAPNPSTGIFTISLRPGAEAVSYSVADMQGSIVARRNIYSLRSFTIDLSYMPKGMYLLRVVDKQQKNQTIKLIVQ